MPPLVSVVIPYYRRGDVFERCLDTVLAQTYPSYEVIVVDNHSQDGIEERIAARGAAVTLISNPDNLGACGARNRGIEAAKGEILVCIDDDVSFMSEDGLDAIVRTFQARPDIGVLALQVCDPHTGEVRVREWCHTRPYAEFVEAEFETNWFGEGASALRREVFDRCGTFYEPLFYGAEGHDLILRVLDGGFRILHTPQIRVGHWAAAAGRTTARQYYYFTRNYIWMAYKDYRFRDGMAFLAPKLLMLSYFSWRSGTYRPFLQGLRDGVRGLARLRQDRTPISRSTIRYLRELEAWRPGLMTRLARHRREPQI